MQRRKALMTLAAIMTAASLTACGSGVKEGIKDGMNTATSQAEEVKDAAESVQDSVVQEESVQESVVQEPDSVVEAVEESVEEEVKETGPNDLPDDNPLKGIADPEEMRVVYDEINDLMNDMYLNSDMATETDGEKVRAAEDALINQVAEAHSLTYDDVSNIYTYGGIGSLYNYDKDSIKITHGDFVEATINGTTLVVKAKIEPSFSNKATIDQNYYNVCDIIRDQNAGVFHEIQYWAVADMTSGEESKVISFTVPKDMIDLIASQDFADNTLGDYVEDLWIHPSLQ